MIPATTVLYASTDCPEAVTEAREYIAREGFSSEQVRLIRRDGMILVISKVSI